MRNRYFIKLMMLLLLSISSSVSFAEEVDENVLPERNQLMEMVDTKTAEPEEIVTKIKTGELAARTDRAWGLRLGDELNVSVDTGTLDDDLNETSFPQEGKRYGTWLYLKTIDVEAQQLVFHYQVVNVPNKNTSVETPTFDIKQNDGKWFTIPSIPLTIGPALAAEEGLSNIQIKKDIAPTLISTDEMQGKLKLFSIIALISWLSLALWHFGWKTKNRAPFAQALHDLGRLRWKGSVSPDEASRILHTAFNKTSNTIVVYGELDTLIENHPWLAPLQDDIRSFYQQSEQHFFARQAGQEPDRDMIKKLAKACRSKEMLA